MLKSRMEAPCSMAPCISSLDVYPGLLPIRAVRQPNDWLASIALSSLYHASIKLDSSAANLYHHRPLQCDALTQLYRKPNQQPM